MSIETNPSPNLAALRKDRQKEIIHFLNPPGAPDVGRTVSAGTRSGKLRTSLTLGLPQFPEVLGGLWSPKFSQSEGLRKPEVPERIPRYESQTHKASPP